MNLCLGPLGKRTMEVVNHEVFDRMGLRFKIL